MNSQIRQELVNRVQLTELELQDSITLGELHTENENIFKIVTDTPRPLESKDAVHMIISYELSLDRTLIQRNVFSFLDWLGDVGGLLEILFIFYSLIYQVYHYQTFEEYLTRKLYRKK